MAQSYMETTSAILGEYMLKGWTLTDLACPYCRTTPLMREPAGQALAAGRGEGQRIEFCGRCQGRPGGQVVAPMEVEARSIPPPVPRSPSPARRRSPANPTSPMRPQSMVINAPPRNSSLMSEPLSPAQAYARQQRGDGPTRSRSTEISESGEAIDLAETSDGQIDGLAIPNGEASDLIRSAHNRLSPGQIGSNPSGVPISTPSLTAAATYADHLSTPTGFPLMPTSGPRPTSSSSIQMDPAEQARAARQTQSDLASSRLSTYLLRGYALLGETCPNSTCYGVPLIRHPRKRERDTGESSSAVGRTGGLSGSTVEDKKECVICRKVYDSVGRVILDPAVAGNATSATQSAGAGPSHASRAAQVNGRSGPSTETDDLDARKAALYGTAAPTALPNRAGPAPTTAMVDDFDAEMDAIMRDVEEPVARAGDAPSREVMQTVRASTTHTSAINPVARAIATAESALSEVLTQLSHSMTQSIAAPGRHAGSIDTGDNLKAHLDRMKDVIEVLGMAKKLKAAQ